MPVSKWVADGEISEEAQAFIADLLTRCEFVVDSNAASGATPSGATSEPATQTISHNDIEAASRTVPTRVAPPTETAHVDCAVSGGADSLSLMILARAAGFRVTAWHIDHGLRPGSHDEAEFVAAVAHRFGIDFESRAVTVPPGPDLEARARHARHGVLPSAVLFGHTAEDLTETVLLRLLRGTGPSGIAAMTAKQHPILLLRRRETERLCELIGIQPFEDPTNVSPDFKRNRVRYELLPLMADIAERDVVPLFARFAELSGEQREFISLQAAQIDPTNVHVLREVHSVVAQEALRQWWLETTQLGYPPNHQAISRMMEVVRGGIPGCDVVSGWHLRRSQGKLSLQRLFPDHGERG